MDGTGPRLTDFVCQQMRRGPDAAELQHNKVPEGLLGVFCLQIRVGGEADQGGDQQEHAVQPSHPRESRERFQLAHSDKYINKAILEILLKNIIFQGNFMIQCKTPNI